MGIRMGSEKSWDVVLILPKAHCRHLFRNDADRDGCLHFEKKSAAVCDEEECPIRYVERNDD